MDHGRAGRAGHTSLHAIAGNSQETTESFLLCLEREFGDTGFVVRKNSRGKWHEFCEPPLCLKGPFWRLSTFAKYVIELLGNVLSFIPWDMFNDGHTCHAAVRQRLELI